MTVQYGVEHMNTPPHPPSLIKICLFAFPHHAQLYLPVGAWLLLASCLRAIAFALTWVMGRAGTKPSAAARAEVACPGGRAEGGWLGQGLLLLYLITPFTLPGLLCTSKLVQPGCWRVVVQESIRVRGGEAELCRRPAG